MMMQFDFTAAEGSSNIARILMYSVVVWYFFEKIGMGGQILNAESGENDRHESSL